MSKIYQAETLFQEKMGLTHLKQRVDAALEAQQQVLAQLNKGQTAWQIQELDWEIATCFCTVLDHAVSQDLLKKAIKCFLIEQFGERALHLKINFSPSLTGQELPGRK